MRNSLQRWIDDHGEVGPDDAVVIAYAGDRPNDVLEAGEALANINVQARSIGASALLNPDTMEFVRSSAAQRIVLICVQRQCIRTETIGEFLATCRRYGKDVAFRTIADSGAS